MSDITYVEVVWTAGDIITEAKMDNMVANQRAVDAMEQGILLVERAAPATPASNHLHLYSKDKAGVSTLYMINDGAEDIQVSERHSAFLFPYPGVLIVDTSVTPIILITRPMQIVKAYAVVKTGPIDADIIVDINKNGSTIWTTQADRLKVLNGATEGTQTAFNVTTLDEGDKLTMDIDQVGSTVAGEDLTVVLKCK